MSSQRPVVDQERKRFSPLLFRFLVLITLIGLGGGFFLGRWLYTGSNVLRIADITGQVTSSTPNRVCIKQTLRSPKCAQPVLDPTGSNVIPEVGVRVRGGFLMLPGARNGRAPYLAWLYFEKVT